MLSYLPLSHVAAQMLDIHLMMRLGGTVYFTSYKDIRYNFITCLKQVSIRRPSFFDTMYED